MRLEESVCEGNGQDRGADDEAKEGEAGILTQSSSKADCEYPLDGWRLKWDML